MALYNKDYEWTFEQYRLVDIIDGLNVLSWRLRGAPQDSSPERCTRPGDADRQRERIEKSRSIKKSMEQGNWEEVS